MNYDPNNFNVLLIPINGDNNIKQQLIANGFPLKNILGAFVNQVDTNVYPNLP